MRLSRSLRLLSVITVVPSSSVAIPSCGVPMIKLLPAARRILVEASAVPFSAEEICKDRVIELELSRFVTLMYLALASSRAPSEVLTAALNDAIVVSLFAGHVTMRCITSLTPVIDRVFVDPLSMPLSVSSSLIVVVSVAIIYSL
jgi:hypothetical protein